MVYFPIDGTQKICCQVHGIEKDQPCGKPNWGKITMRTQHPPRNQMSVQDPEHKVQLQDELCFMVTPHFRLTVSSDGAVEGGIFLFSTGYGSPHPSQHGGGRFITAEVQKIR